MAKIRKSRPKKLSAQEAMEKTVDITRAQAGPDIKVSTIKYKNIKQGSKLHEHVREYLDSVGIYQMARYDVAHAGYRLQTLLDKILVEKGELSHHYEWKFKLLNHVWARHEKTLEDGTKKKIAVLMFADLECYDAPGYSFTTKLDTEMPGEENGVVDELGFVDLGDINVPAAVPPAAPPNQPSNRPQSAPKVASDSVSEVQPAVQLEDHLGDLDAAVAANALAAVAAATADTDDAAAAAASSDTSQDGYPSFNLPTTFTGHALAYQEAYTSLTTIALKLLFFERELDRDEEQPFYASLLLDQQREIYPHLPDQIKTKVTAPPAARGRR